MDADETARLSRKLARHIPAWALGWSSPAELGMLYTPLDHCLCAEVGPVKPDVVQQLVERRLDQAPVVTRYSEHDRPGFPEGLVTTEYLKSLLEKGSPRQRDDPEIAAATVPLEPTLGVLLDTLSKSRAALVIEEERQETATLRSFRGLITISDLNRQSFRSLLYTLLAEFEAGLARCLEVSCTDPWAWLGALSEEHQVRLLGYWELSKRNSVDVSPVAAATLAMLLTVIGKMESLRSKLGYPSRKQFDDATGKMARLRNQVMHPVRPLVLAVADVAEIREILTVVLSLCQTLAKLGFMESPRTPDGHLAVTLATTLTKPRPEPASN